MSGMEDRLGDMLTRIATETQEIKELEQQLTDGQVLANAALRRDLEGIVSGLQEHLRGLGRLDEQDVFVQQGALSVSESQTVRDGQQMELEAELWSHAALGKEDESSLQQEVQTLQAQLDWTRIQLRRISGVLLDPEEPARDTSSPQDTLSRNMEQVYTAAQNTRTRMRRLQQDHTCCLEQVTGLQVQLQAGQNHIRELEAQLAPGPDLDQDQDQPDPLRLQGAARQGRRRRRLSGSTCDGAQLTATTEQLRALNQTVDQLLSCSQQDPPLGSRGSQDSGLGLQYLSSPEGRRQQDRLAAGEVGWGGSVPPTHTDSHRERRKQAPPPPPPPHTVSTGPPGGLQGPAWLLCVPPAGGAAPHCNIPEHRITTHKCKCECVNREKLQGEMKNLQRTVRRNRQVMQVCDEVECVEKTLLRRRAELRQADRLLLEAENCISSSRERASSAHREVVVLQQTVEDGATCLLEVIRELEEEVEELRRRRQEEEQILKEVEELRRRRRAELERLGVDVHSASVRLADVLSDCQDSQRRLNSLVTQAAQQEQKLVRQREEVREEQQLLKELREQQEALLSDHRAALAALKKDTRKLNSVRSELHTHRAELKQVLQELLTEQRELQEEKNKHSQKIQLLQEKQAQLDSIQEDVDRSQAELDRSRAELDRSQAELDRSRAELDRTQAELDRSQAELDRSRAELDRSQAELDRTQAELDRSQAELDRTVDELGDKRGEVDRKREELLQLQQEVEQQRAEVQRRREEKSSVEEQCKHLEARRRHADRCLSTVEAGLAKQREELRNGQIPKQEALGVTAVG